MLVKCPAPYTPAWSTFPKAPCEIAQQYQCTDLSLCVLLGPVEVLQDLIKYDIEDDEMPPDVRNVFFWGLWDIKRISFLTAIVNQTSVVMDSSDQSVEFLANQGLIDDFSQKMA
ncbi:hypothetical protein P7K49_014506 [Saguinus oedipus]|uniref:Uncharacterized protein n=1 Tax=Saguinus oedipus TaxID=9490 RepID=A0ABQ9VJM1_SAGOE|nr:hypothetical protein P7K49_014506 [Saguinus oedipus]